MRNFLTISFLLLFAASAQSQIVSYGDDEIDEDSIKIAQAAPQFIDSQYRDFEDYLETALQNDVRIRNISTGVNGVNVLLKFIIKKNGLASKISVDCNDNNLIFPLESALESMNPWKAGIINDNKVNTKMEYYYNVTMVEAGQYVFKEERIPPKLDKSTWPIKLGVMSACIAGLIWAWVRF